jgi:2-hydroxychromene-2-carboxylate isomerase
VVEPIPFYFDFISPYAYLGWVQVHALATRHGREIRPIPVLFAGLLDAHGNVGPAEVPAKRTYIFKDALRSALTLGVAFKPPPSHPFNPLLALRVASLPLEAAEQRRVIDVLFSATWGAGIGVTSPETVSACLSEAGFDGDDLVSRAGAAEVKALVRSNTDAAIATGVFGVPTLLVEGELFWGVDSFAHAARRLSGADPLTPEILAGFRDVPASATRPRAPRPEK